MNMKTWALLRHTVLLTIAVAGTMAQAAGEVGSATGVLTVQASGFADTQGHAVAKLFQPGDNVLDKGRWESTAAIKDGQATLTFPPLPAGTYALVVFHDRNDNGHIDHGWMGPSEPLGFSGGFKLTLLSGRPTFEELKFSFDGQPRMMDIVVKPF
jgi:uncharacterized protein (DUF2141 family)